MALAAGTMLGAYQITRLIGVGGMGEVYQARDTRLRRDVAIKSLPVADTGRIARFQREAEILAALSHPHIAGIYGLEERDGAQFLVLELVDGGTLADRLRQGPLRATEALAIARQIADALEAAHAKGIIHRDLKPGNIALTADGQVKVLDFGLAKLDRDTGALPQAATAVADKTSTGVVLGTAAYMSPEQARGATVDRRTDIWAFGCVLYEMLTGQPAFGGQTVSDVLVAILEREPELAVLPASMPTRVDWLIRRCLEKDANRRLHDIADARIELDEALREPSAARAAGQPSPAPRRREVFAWTAAVILGIGAVALAANLLGTGDRTAPSTATFTTSITLPDDLSLGASALGATAAGRFALAPDGRRLALVATDAAGAVRLYLRPLESSVPQPLPGTENALFPFWSPDSGAIAFVADGKLKRIDLAGGAVVTIADTALPATGTWNRDGIILFTPGPGTSLHRVPATGGTPRPATTLDAEAGDAQHWFPSFLPDGRHFVYFAVGSRAGGATDARAVLVGSLDTTGPGKTLVEPGSNAKYANGYLFFSLAGRLVAQPFDTERLELRGAPLPVVEQVQDTGSGATRAAGAFSVSETGVLAFQSAIVPRSQLAWFDRSGLQLSTLGTQADYGDVMLSPDGTRAAVSIAEPASGLSDIWIFDLARNVRERVTLDPGGDFAPIWSRENGREIIHSAQRQGGVNLYRRPAGGGDTEQLLWRDDLGKFASDWSSDGRFLVYIAGGGIIRRSDLWILRVDGTEPARPFIQTAFPESHAQFSPDGRWLAYMSSESGVFEVYVTPFPGPGERRQVSTAGGGWPRWRRDGGELFYLAADPDMNVETPARYNTVTAVTVDGDGPSFEVAGEQRLFKARPRPIGRLDAFPYDVSADGRRFLINTSVDTPSAAPLTLVVNWPAVIAR